MKTILLVKPREGKAPALWPDQVTVHLQRGRVSRQHAWQYAVTGFSTLIEYNTKTIVPLDREALLDIMRQWREMYGRGIWDFYLKPEGHRLSFFDPRRKRMYFIQESL